MTWKTLMDLLSTEFRRLRAVPVVNFGFASQPVLDPHDLRTEELQSAERVNAIIRDFARTRRWPALHEKERFFLRERIRFAYEYASIAETTVKRPINLATRRHILNEQRRLLEWLLIDVWRESGVLNWIEPFLLLSESTPEAAPDWQLDVAE